MRVDFEIRERTDTNDTLGNITAKLALGNPGAATCLAHLYKTAVFIRPLVFAHCVLMFETLNLRGDRLYMLWNDCLDRNTHALIRLVADWRNDRIDNETILRHVNAEGGRGIPLELYTKGVFS